MNALAHLRGKIFEPLKSKNAGGALVCLRQWWRYGEVIARVQGNDLVDQPELVREPRQLLAHPIEAAQQRGVVNRLDFRIQKAFESEFHNGRLARAWLLGRGFQPLDDLLGKLHADFSLHRWSSLDFE